MKFSHSFVVGASDIDDQGHVNNVAYVRWVQHVAVEHWNAVASEEIRDRFTWMLTRHEIDYKRQVFENEAVTAITWVGERTRVSWERFTEIRRDGDIVAKSRSVWCLIDRRSGKPARIAGEIIDVL